MKAVHIFPDTDMRLWHEGLFNHAKSRGVNIKKLGSQESVLFINVAKNKIKAFSSNGVLSYLRLDDGTVTLDHFNAFPGAVVAGKPLGMSKVTRNEILKALGIPASRARLIA